MTPDALTLPAFVISIVGLLVALIAAATGIVALRWQIVTRTRGAHRIKVNVSSRMRLHFEDNPEPDRDYLQLRVANTGLTAVEVRSWAIQLRDKTSLMVLNPHSFPPQPRLPHVLQPGTAVDFFIDTAELTEGRDKREFEASRPVVILSTGEFVFGRRKEIDLG